MAEVIPLQGERKPCAWNLADDVRMTPCDGRAISEVDGYRLCLMHISTYSRHKRLREMLADLEQNGS
jgi:hypothetical protein